jgi:hypothetical protein
LTTWLIGWIIYSQLGMIHKNPKNPKKHKLYK